MSDAGKPDVALSEEGGDELPRVDGEARLACELFGDSLEDGRLAPLLGLGEESGALLGIDEDVASLERDYPPPRTQ